MPCYDYLLPLWAGNIQKELNSISHMCMCVTSLIESGAEIHVWMCCQIVNGVVIISKLIFLCTSHVRVEPLLKSISTSIRL